MVGIITMSEERSNSCEKESDSSEIYLALLYERDQFGVALFDAARTTLQIGEFWAFSEDIISILQRSSICASLQCLNEAHSSLKYQLQPQKILISSRMMQDEELMQALRCNSDAEEVFRARQIILSLKTDWIVLFAVRCMGIWAEKIDCSL